jgi:chorismate mutase
MGTGSRCLLLADLDHQPTPRAEPRGVLLAGASIRILSRKARSAMSASPTSTAVPAVTDADADRAAAAEAIPVLRGQIDAMDEAITRLVAERARLSTRIQTARMNAGGTRVELGRERVILDTYRSALGSHGPALADAVLLVCRGSR